MIVIRFYENDNKEEWEIRFDKIKDPVKEILNDILIYYMPLKKKYELYKELEKL